MSKSSSLVSLANGEIWAPASQHPFSRLLAVLPIFDHLASWLFYLPSVSSSGYRNQFVLVTAMFLAADSRPQ